MAADNRKADSQADALQKEGTREFDEAISGEGPAMPPETPKTAEEKEEEQELEEALEDTFPASDPVKLTTPKSGLGAPKGRQSAD